MKLLGKQALVTGGGRGIGRAISTTLAARGARVAVHYADSAGGGREEAERTVEMIVRAGGRAFAVQADFLAEDPAALLSRFREGALAVFGCDALDVLVNNAALNAPAPFLAMTALDLDRHLAVNLRAPFLLVQAAARASEGGLCIVNVSSSTTRVLAPDQAAYTVTKGGLNTMTWYLARELAERGIRLNGVVVGVTRTELSEQIMGEDGLVAMAAASPLGRVGEPDDIADVVAFLASDSARWVIGETVDVTGGQTLRPAL